MTVDIAALREMRDLANRIIECKGENSDGEDIIHLYDMADTIFEAENILGVLDQLEAAQARIAELESKQEPVGEIKENPICYYADFDRMPPLGTKLYTAPSKPIVLPQPFAVRTGHPFNDGARTCMIPDDKGNWLSKLGVEHAIKIAGGIVKNDD